MFLQNLPSVQDANSHMLWLLGIGVTCSTALSIKWTTLATPGMIAVESFMAVFFIRTPVNFGYLLGVLAVIIVLYSFWWAIHFWYLPLSGDGDGFMPMEFQKTLVNGTHYEVSGPLHWHRLFCALYCSCVLLSLVAA
jgi:dolichyl-phosphate-mannose--protein O-mannosyl transferase